MPEYTGMAEKQIIFFWYIVYRCVLALFLWKEKWLCGDWAFDFHWKYLIFVFRWFLLDGDRRLVQMIVSSFFAYCFQFGLP